MRRRLAVSLSAATVALTCVLALGGCNREKHLSKAELDAIAESHRIPEDKLEMVKENRKKQHEEIRRFAEEKGHYPRTWNEFRSAAGYKVYETPDNFVWYYMPPRYDPNWFVCEVVHKDVLPSPAGN